MHRCPQFLDMGNPVYGCSGENVHSHGHGEGGFYIDCFGYVLVVPPSLEKVTDKNCTRA